MLKNFKPISLILLAGATCFPASIFAETMPSKQGMNISQQNGKVTGTVVDDLGPVAGASVVVKGTTNGNITDMDGNFTLEGVKNGDIIQISHLCFFAPLTAGTSTCLRCHIHTAVIHHFFQHTDCLRGNPLSASGKSKSLFCRCLDINLIRLNF